MNTGDQALQYPIRPANASRKFNITSTPMTATSHETLVSSIIEAFADTVASSKMLQKFSPITPTANGFQVYTVPLDFIFKKNEWLGITTALSQSVAQYVLLSLTCYVVDLISKPLESEALHQDCQNKLFLAHTFLYNPSEFPRTVLTRDQAGEVFDTIIKTLVSLMPGVKFEVKLEPVLTIIVESVPVAVPFLCFETIAIFSASLVAAAFQAHKEQGTDLLEGLSDVVAAVSVQEGLVMSGRRKHKVYIITEFPLTKHVYTSASKIEFKVISYSDGNVEKLTKTLNNIFIESSRLNRKVFIVCSSIGRHVPTVPVDTYSVINDAFRAYFSNNANQALRNLVVIHETDNIGRAVVSFGSIADQKVRKICNVFNYDSDGTVVIDGWDLVENVESPDLFSMKVGEPMMFAFSPFQPTPLPHDVALDDLWWFTNFNVDAPACADGRTTQITGSCWWNSTVNVLLMTKSIADILVQKWHSLPEKYKQEKGSIGLDACPDKSMELKEFMFILINQLLVLGKRAKYSEDFSTYGALLTNNASNEDGAFAALFKAEHTPGKRFLPQDLGRKQGGRPFNAVFTILSQMLEMGTDFSYVWLTAEEATLFQTPGAKLDWNNKSGFWEEYPNPKVVVVTCHAKVPPCFSCLPSITVNGSEYLLSSSTMEFPGHAVAGLTCGNLNGKPDFYVYDSNNQLSRDDWPSGQVPNYVKLVHANKDPDDPVDRSVFKGFEFFIYTRSVVDTNI